MPGVQFLFQNASVILYIYIYIYLYESHFTDLVKITNKAFVLKCLSDLIIRVLHFEFITILLGITTYTPNVEDLSDQEKFNLLNLILNQQAFSCPPPPETTQTHIK